MTKWVMASLGGGWDVAQGDFDLSDALDDNNPEPTKKPSSDIYPRPKPPPVHPNPGGSEGGGLYPNLPRPQPDRPDNGGNIYPRPKPPPAHPQPGGSDGGGYYHDGHDDGRYPPRPRPPSGGGGGGGYHNPGHDGYGNTHGDGYATYGDQHGGNTVAKVVSPIVSMVVVTLVGAAVGYYNRRGGAACCRRNSAPENV
ncbi:glycoprotein Xg [Suncus etruscus]|uniref:glycoprotein Xg n=1 Tax=Suncus etruscus TaxID=109475 RepID=UPI00210F4CD3|nr:glycoprotein Xg [Suncus etruscus]